MNNPLEKLSIVLPAKNESAGLRRLLPQVSAVAGTAEIIVVDDGSTDDTAAVAEELGARVVRHPYSIGNGGAIKSGVRHAQGGILVFMDADGQHEPKDIPRLLAKVEDGFDMVVGARGNGSQASISRGLANRFYNWLARYMTGQYVADLTSGFRVARAEKFRQFLYLLPNGFSYPTTSTMAFFRSGYSVTYVPIEVAKRIGRSHVSPLKDGVRFLVIIFRIGTLYSPLKLFLPTSLLFSLLGLGHYIHTYVTESRFTNMSALLFSISVIIFLIGLVSEQITQLMYRPTDNPPERDQETSATSRQSSVSRIASGP